MASDRVCRAGLLEKIYVVALNAILNFQYDFNAISMSSLIA